MFLNNKIKQLNKNIENNSIGTNPIKRHINEKTKTERQSTRQTTGRLGKLFNRILGTGRRIESEIKSYDLFTYITNSFGNQAKLTFNNTIVAKGSHAEIYKLEVVNRSKHEKLIYKSIKKDILTGKKEYKGFRFHYLLQKYLKSNNKRLLNYLCNLYEYGFIGKQNDYSQIYAIMGDCGIELNKYIIQIKKQGKLTLYKIINIMIQCAKALQILHDIKYCHLDIKPQNFLVIPIDDTNIQIKIIDFELVTKFTETTILSIIKYNYSNGYFGTLKYMIPKMVYNYLNERNKRIKKKKFKIDGSIDIFSLGCMFYEFLIIYKLEVYENFFENIFVCPHEGNLQKRANYKNYFNEDIIKLGRLIYDEVSIISNLGIIDILSKMVNPNTNEREKYKISILIEELELELIKYVYINLI